MTKFKCTQCPKEYQSEKDLERHLKKIHGLSVVVLKQTSDEKKEEFLNSCLEQLKEQKKIKL